MQKKVLDSIIEPLDFRYSASIVGLYKYLSFFGTKGEDFIVTEDEIKYCSKDITEERYLKFVEYYYREEFQHLKIEDILKKHDITIEEQEIVNEILNRGNAVYRKVFSKERFNGRNKAKILSLIRRNRDMIIRETFRNKRNMYSNFANPTLLFKEQQDRCRLLGYYVDITRKSRANSYNFNPKTFRSSDDKIFDFIPFAFQGERQSFFINNSSSVLDLIKTNMDFERYMLSKETLSDGKESLETINASRVLFQNIQRNPSFIDYDTEVILKDQEKEYFQTMYVRKENIEILRKIGVYSPFCVFFKINDHYILDMQEEVLSCILNLIRTDHLIELSLKKKQKKYLISLLIKINLYICKNEERLRVLLEQAEQCGSSVSRRLQKNVIKFYKNQLTKLINFKDYDGFCQLLLYISDCTDIIFEFMYSLIEDFEENKDVAYAFINALDIRTEDK